MGWGMRQKKSFAILLSCLFVTMAAQAVVVVDAKKAPFDNSELPPRLRSALETRMRNDSSNRELNTYKVTVNADTNRLGEEPVIEGLGILAKDLKGVIPAEQLLSPYAKKWAYQLSEGHGPNCWHTSISSIFLGWAQPRRMPPKEFHCHVENSFEQIDRPSQWGDLIRLSAGQMEVHGFTYLGVDSSDPTRAIVFTKNGRYQSKFLFMDLATVRDYVYPGNDVTFYRKVRPAIDPKEDSSAPCYAESLTDDNWNGSEE